MEHKTWLGHFSLHIDIKMQLGEKWNQNKTTISIKIQFSHSHKNHLTQNTNMKSGWKDALIKKQEPIPDQSSCELSCKW